MRRSSFAGLGALMLVGSAPAAAQTVEVWKSPSCSCCSAWVGHLAENGFGVQAKDVANGELARIKAKAGIKPEQQSCHTGKVGGYVIEGHVPAEDIRRLLSEKPDGIGLTVPGMPIGSPGMEMGEEKEPYEVLLIRRDGRTEVFARH
jgi:hypothetical protein